MKSLNFVEHNFDYLLLLSAKIIASKNQRQKLNLIEILKNQRILQEDKLHAARQRYLSKKYSQQNLNQFIITIYYWIQLSNFYIQKYTSSFYSIPADGLCKILEGLSNKVKGYKQLALSQMDNMIVKNFEYSILNAKRLKEKIQGLKKQPPPPPAVPNMQQPKQQQNEQRKYPPPNDFRNLTACPTPSELLSKNEGKIYLNKLLIQGAYNDLNDYLDCNFRLLKQDFICNLRQGIQEYKDGLLQQYKSQNIKIYKNCQLFQFKIIKGQTYMILTIPSNRNKKWHRTKDLKYGSLLVLSFDNFRKDMHFGVIKDKDQKQMNKTTAQYGCVFTPIELHEEELSNFEFFSKFNQRQLTIIEPKVFFEAYYHVLNCLQEIYNLPFSQIIVDANIKQLYHPQFMNQIQFRYVQRYIAQHSFDKSQARSISYCFNHQVSLIQGPPGTGKTYVGVHIVNIMLNILQRKYETEMKYNKHQRYQPGPIFIVCYTNHALDQFLEKIQQYTKDIIRMGGRSKNQQFRKYSLIQVKKWKNINRRKAFYGIKDDRDALMKQIDLIQKQYFYYLHCGVVSFKQQQNIPYPIQIEIKKMYDYYYNNCMQYAWNECPEKVFYKFQAFVTKLFKVIEFPEILFWLQILDFDFVYNMFEQEEKQKARKLAKKENSKQQQIDEDQDNDFGVLQDQQDKYKKNLDIKKSWESLQFLQMQPLFYAGQEQKFQTYRQLIQFNINQYRSQAIQQQQQLNTDFVLNKPQRDPTKLPLHMRWKISIAFVNSRIKSSEARLQQIQQEIQKKTFELDKMD